jgi:DNA polymerase elongation subunit (family B)
MKFYTNVYYDYSSILYAEIDDHGNKKYLESPFVQTVFLPSKSKTDQISISGEYLSELKFDSFDSYKEFIKNYSEVKNFDIYGDIQAEYHFIHETYGSDMLYDFSKIDIMYIDIETTSEKGWPVIENPEESINVISISSTKTGKATFCLGRFKTTQDVRVFEFEDESDMLQTFIDYFAANYPDIVSGWNIRFFDFPYLINRIKVLLGTKAAKKLSPWGKLKDRQITRNSGKEEQVYDIVGVSMLDYYEVYQTFTYVNQESYALNHIAYVELGERKLSYSEYENITEFYRKDFQKFVEYNIRDVELVQKLEEVALAYSAGVNFSDVFSQVRTWDVIIYKYLKNRGIMIPPKRKGRKDEQYAGAYVKEPVPGKYNWVVSFDLNSLYPHLIMQYNISPETLTEDGLRGVVAPEGVLKGGEVTTKALEKYKSKNLSVAANGTTYRKDIRGFLPELMDKMYKDRKMFKKKMIESEKNLEDINAEMKKRGLL